MTRFELLQSGILVTHIAIVFVLQVVRALVALPPLLEAVRFHAENRCSIAGIEDRIFDCDDWRIRRLQAPEPFRNLRDPGRRWSLI